MIKKRIKIKFVDFYSSFAKQENDFLNVLNDRYEVEISDNPDYIIYSGFGYEHLNYDCVRIFFTGECDVPNFNVCDYAIGFDRLSFGDRYARIPLYMMFQYKNSYLQLNSRNEFTKDMLDKKTGFCNFVYSNCFAQDNRTIMFEKLSQYKKVDSGGRYRNNIGGAVKDKLTFQQNYKFSIAFENTSYNGYCTEKLPEAFAARTIPIYYGDPMVAEDFDERAFVNCHKYSSFDEVIDRVKEIDQNDELYLEMINTPPVIIQKQPLADFLYHIFDQDYEKAYRRSFSIPAKNYEAMIKRHRFFETNIYQYYKMFRNQLERYKSGTMLSPKRTK